MNDIWNSIWNHKGSIFAGVNFIYSIIVTILLFFKTSLNNILTEYWKERQDKKKNELDRLKDFRQVLLFQRDVCIYLFTISKGLVVKIHPDKLKISEAFYSSLANNNKDTLASVNRHLSTLPQELINGYKDALSLFEKNNSEVLEGADVTKASAIMKEEYNKLIAMTEKYIK